MLSENTTAGLAKYLPTPYKKRRYYTKKELLLHNTPNDIWVSFFEDVYDLTALVQLHRLDPHVDALITVAGSDITRWFDHKTKSPKKCTD